MTDNNLLNNQKKVMPENWKFVKLGNITDFINGFAFSSSDYVKRGVLNFRVSNIEENGKINIQKDTVYLPNKFIDEYSDYLLQPNDILLVMVGASTGKLGQIPNRILPALQNQNMWNIRPKGINPNKEFLFYALLYLIPNHLNKSSGSARGFIKKQDFRNIDFPLPTLPEQRAISHILNTVRQDIDSTEQVISAAQELKRSMMNHLFTYGPIPVDQTNKRTLKETEIGNFPNNWEISQIGQVCDVNPENRDPSVEEPENEFMYIDISSVESETGVITSPSMIIGRHAPSRARRVVHTNDVILSTVRPYLKAFALVPSIYDNQICSTGFAVLKCKTLASSKYLYYASLSEVVGQQFQARMKGANYPAINQGDVKETRIPVPPSQEQIKIGNFLSKIDKKILIEKQRKSSLEVLFNSLLHDLMTGKIKVIQ